MDVKSLGTLNVIVLKFNSPLPHPLFLNNVPRRSDCLILLTLLKGEGQVLCTHPHGKK